MLSASETTAIATALDELDRAVALAAEAADRASPWWRHLIPYQSDVDQAAQSARNAAESLAALRAELHRKVAELAAAPGHDPAAAAQYLRMAQAAAKRWVPVADLAAAVEARPREVVGGAVTAATTAVDVARGAAQGVAGTLQALPVILGAAALLAVWLFVRSRGRV